MAGKISEYTTEQTTLDDTDRLDVSTDLAGTPTTKYLSWGSLKTQLGTAGFLSSGDNVSELVNDAGFVAGNLYTTDGTVGAGRIATLTDSLQLRSSSAIPFNLYKTSNSGNVIVQYKAENSASSEYSYAQAGGRIENNTAGSEEGSFLVQLSEAGTVSSAGAHKFLINGLTQFPESINGGIYRDAGSNTNGIRWTMNLNNSIGDVEPYAGIAAEIIDNTASSEDGILKFYSRTGGVNFSGSNYGMALTGAGLKIGTGTPTSKLHVGGDTQIDGFLGISTAPTAAKITIKGVGSATDKTISSLNTNTAESFYVQNDGTVYSPAIKINNTGTIATNMKLQVIGNSQLTGTVQCNSIGINNAPDPNYTATINGGALASIRFNGNMRNNGNSAAFTTLINATIGADAPPHGNGTDNNTILDIRSENRGALLLPRITEALRDSNITNPIAGHLVYNTTTNKINFYNGSAWEVVTSA